MIHAMSTSGTLTPILVALLHLYWWHLWYQWHSYTYTGGKSTQIQDQQHTHLGSKTPRIIIISSSSSSSIRKGRL
eukprot:1162125-Pelagomonas_calceolata.AAC.2